MRRAELVERRVEDARVEAVLVGAVRRAALNSDGFLEQRLGRVVREIVGKLCQLGGRRETPPRPSAARVLRGRVPDALGGTNVEPVRGSALGAVRGWGRRLRAPRRHIGWLERIILRGRHRDVVGVQDDGVLPPRPRIWNMCEGAYHRERARRRLGGNANGRGNANGWANGWADWMDDGMNRRETHRRGSFGCGGTPRPSARRCWRARGWGRTRRSRGTRRSSRRRSRKGACGETDASGR